MNTEPSKKPTERLRNIVPPVPRRFKRVPSEDKVEEAFQNIPRITNETLAEHREEVLRGARKYKYPLQHSKHRIVVYSTALLVVALVGFFVYCGLALYKFQSSSGFIYRVTQVLPFPVARAGKQFVAYENYLFELRRYEHYYLSQQRVDVTENGQLDRYKPVAMQEVTQTAYVKQLAAQHHVGVSNTEVSDAVAALRAQNHSSTQELAEVTNKFFGWSISDLQRELRQELLADKLAATLDMAAQSRAHEALGKVQSGADFGQTAAQYSDDAATKGNGGQYADTALTAASTDVPFQVIQALQGMKVGQVSGIIEAGKTLEIVKLLGNDGGKLKAAHISFNVADVSTYVAPYQKTHPLHTYIKIPPLPPQGSNGGA